MSLNRLARQLRREAKANPKKAAVLGLLGLVAVYFWGPLVWGWCVASEKPGGEPAAAGKETVAADTAPAAIAYAAMESSESSNQPKIEACPYRWGQLDQWMQADPMTTPVDDVTGWPDPFGGAAPVAEAEEAAVAQADTAPVTTETLEVDVSGTLVGPRRRVALIEPGRHLGG